MPDDMPRLSESLPNVRAPDRCQACGLDGPDLDRWREREPDDVPRDSDPVVVLCEPCSEELIAPHPRLYARMDRNQPDPGSMILCVDCPHRRALDCTHPDARKNGGPGVLLTIPPAVRVHVHSTDPALSGPRTIWRAPARRCRQKDGTGHRTPPAASQGPAAASVESDPDPPGWKKFSVLQIQDAYRWSRKGGQALHLHRVIADRSKAPKVFVDAIDRGEHIAHYFDLDLDRLRRTAKELGVKVVAVEGIGQHWQHVDLCGGPLKRALARCEGRAETQLGLDFE